MPPLPSPCPSRCRFSYKIAAALACTCNLLAVLYALHLLLSPLYLSSPLGLVHRNVHLPLKAVRYTKEQLRRIHDAVEVWKAAEPADLIKRVKEIGHESAEGAFEYKLTEALREKVASDLANRLKELRAGSNESVDKALEEWRKEKLEEIKRQEEMTKPKGVDSEAIQEPQAAGMARNLP